LRDPRLSTRSVVEVLGYHRRGDGGGGLFYYDDTSTEPDDLGTVIAPTGTPPPPRGRWKRMHSGALNVRFFGAVGDGIADDSGAITDPSTNS
jgi:hypothetical protein